MALGVALLAVAIVVDSAETGASHRERKLWRNYKTKFNWTHDNTDEETFRFEIFSKRLQQVEEHNGRNLSWTKAINHLSCLSKSELGQLVGDSELITDTVSRSPQELGILGSGDDEHPIPPAHSWLEVPNVVSPARNQGQCGSCWAFATVGLVEGRQRLSSDKLATLSEQQLIDCNEHYDEGRNGCNGLAMNKAADYVIKHGLQTGRDYPYYSSKGLTQECRFNGSNVYPTTLGIEKFSYLWCRDETELAELVYWYGPVSVIIKGDFFELYSYSGGVFSNDRSNQGNDYHAVLLVGYGHESGQDYWLLKNSWSQNWGLNGFFKIPRNVNYLSVALWPSVVL